MQPYTVNQALNYIQYLGVLINKKLVRYLVQVTKLLKRLSNNKLINSIYLYGTVNGKSGWISKAYLAVPAAPKKAVAQPKTAVKLMLLLNLKRLKQLAKLLKLNQTTLVFVLLFMKNSENGAKCADRTFYVTKNGTW